MKITRDKILGYLEGNFRYYVLKKFLGLPLHIKEQALYRLEMCKNDCTKTGKCKKCGCPTEKKVFVTESCNNGEIFPDLMTKEKWEEFKKKNNING